VLHDTKSCLQICLEDDHFFCKFVNYLGNISL